MKKYLTLFIIALMAVFTAFYFFSDNGSAGKDYASSAPEISALATPGGAPLKTFTAKKEDLVIKVVQSGTLKALRSIVLTSEIKSNRAKIIYLAKEGSLVKAGDLLFKFDQTPFTDKLEELESSRDEAKENLVRAQEELEYARTQFDEDYNLAVQKSDMAKMSLKNVKEGEGTLKVEKAKSNVKSAELKLDEAKIIFENANKMLEKGFVTKVDVDKAEIALKQAEDSLYFAQKEHDILVDFTYPIELEEAENEVKKAVDYQDKLKKKHSHEVNGFEAKIGYARSRIKVVENQIKEAESELKHTEVFSPISGFVVYSKNYFGGKMRAVQLGDAIWSNQEVMMIPDTSKMLVESNIREADIYKVKVDQDVDVKVDAYPDLDLKGKVTLIGALAISGDDEIDNDAKYFSMDVEITGRDERLRPGMTARVEIISEVKTDVVTLPIAAVFSADNQSYCYLKSGGSYKKVKVITGAKNDSSVEILKGINTGDTVFRRDEIVKLEMKETEKGFSFLNTISRIFSKDQ